MIDHGDLGPDHPPQLTTDCPHCQRITKINRALREFGYSTLTIAETREAYHVAISREVTAEDGIIAMFTRGFLRDAGLVA